MKENWQLIQDKHPRLNHSLCWGLRLVFVALMLTFLFNFSWQQVQAVNTAVVVPTEIPDEALRLRILAHSDRLEDQWLKERVRDEVTGLIGDWVAEAQTIEEARSILTERLPQLNQVVDHIVREAGMNYGFQIEFGLVNFPTKLYGNKLYPAGEYEGLLITLGAGQGENWWCVLFPPLCFVDFGSGEALEEQAEQPADTIKTGDLEEEEGQHNGPEVRFFLVDLFLKIKSFFL